MALFARRGTTLGLDVGSGHVKLVEIDHRGSEPRVARAAARPVPSGAVADGEVTDPELLAEAIRELVQESGVRTREAVAALGGHHVFVKKVEMPAARADSGNAMRKEAERHVPFDIGGVELDFHVLDGPPSGMRAAKDGEDPVEVLLVAAKREVVDERVALLAQAGLGAVVVDVEAFALHNAFMHNHGQAGQGMVALVDAGHEKTSVSIAENGLPLLSREVAAGCRSLQASLEREMGLPPARAEAVTRGREPLDDLARFVDAMAQELADAVERTSAFLAKRRSAVGLGRIFLSGGAACVPGLVEGLAHRAAVETRLVNPFLRARFAPGAPCTGLSLEESAPMLLLPVGLALRSPQRRRR